MFQRRDARSKAGSHCCCGVCAWVELLCDVNRSPEMAGMRARPRVTRRGQKVGKRRKSLGPTMAHSARLHPPGP